MAAAGPWILVGMHAALLWVVWNPAVGLLVGAPLSAVAGAVAVGRRPWIIPGGIAIGLVVVMYAMRIVSESRGDAGPLEPVVLGAVWWAVSIVAFSIGRWAKP